jgi:hypothetical protein
VAKHVLLRAAEAGNALNLPSISAIGTRYDVLNLAHQAEQQFPNQASKLSSAKEEVRLPTGQVADAVVLTEALAPLTLVVEVFVTHQKSMVDVTQFESIQQNAIEIDISAVAWDASFSEIEAAVLAEAPRKWLFSTLGDVLAEQADKEAEKRARLSSARYQKTLELHVTSLGQMAPSHFSVMRWPELVANAQAKDASGETHVEHASQKVMVDSFPNDWRLSDGFWRAEGSVKGISVDLIAVMAEQPDWKRMVKPLIQRPTLVIPLPVRQNTIAQAVEFHWFGVEKWLAKLKKLAQMNLQQKLAEANKRHQNFDAFVKRFREMDERQRLKLLCDKLGTAPPASPRRWEKAWNAPPTIWKRLVWLYGVRTASSYVSTEGILGNDWLQKLLDFPMDEESQKQRKIQLWYFLKKLEEHKWIWHMQRQVFTTEVRLAEQHWQPWMDER